MKVVPPKEVSKAVTFGPVHTFPTSARHLRMARADSVPSRMRARHLWVGELAVHYAKGRPFVLVRKNIMFELGKLNENLIWTRDP